VWQPWSLRSRAPDAVISHCNVGPWHVIMRAGRPVGFIDWSLAGLPDAVTRGAQLRLFLDGYGLPAAQRSGLITRMIEFAIRDCAGLAEVKQITPESNDPTTL
jgi:hypothetical protein